MENKKELSDDVLASVTGGSKEAYDALTAEVKMAMQGATMKEQLDELSLKYIQLAGKMLEEGTLTGVETIMNFIPFLSQTYQLRLDELNGKI